MGICLESTMENKHKGQDAGGLRRLDELLSGARALDDENVVAFLTAEWLDQVDALVVPYIKQNLAGNERLVAVHRGDSVTTDAQRVSCEQSEFRRLCRELNIQRLPAIVLLDSSSTNTTPPQHQSPTVSDGLHQLISSMRRSANIADWLPVSDYAPLPQDAPTLIELREAANNLFESGDFIAAAKGFTSVLLRCPTCPKSNFNMSVILQMIDETYFAVDHMLRVVEVNDQDAVAHTVLRTVLHPAEPELVIRGYERIVAQYPDHVRAAHSLATLRGEATTASPAYVQQVFDHLAETFEEKLVTHLEYRVPWQIVDALQRSNALPPPTNNGTEPSPYVAVDLGCGTGLCGRLLRPFASHIAGIDLSPLMIEKTRETGFYDELETADIVPFLDGKAKESLDLVVSADVWIYVGELEEIFAVVAKKLRLGGWFAFSTELLASGEGFQLASSGRFKHSDAYIITLATRYGFKVTAHDQITVRKESGEPIPGRIFVLKRD